METAKQHPDEPNSCGSHVDGPSIRTGMESIGNNAETAAEEAETVRTRQMDKKRRNLLHTPQNGTPKHSYQWRKVSVDDAEVYAPLNMLIDTPSRNFVFGQVEGRDKVIVPNVKQRAGDGDGNQNGGDSDVHSTTSSGHVDSSRVEKVLLAIDSQLKRQSRRTRNGNLPVSSMPPIPHAECPYRCIRWQQRRGRLKVETVTASKAPKVKMTYLECVCTMQPHGDDLKRSYGLYRPRCQHGRTKIAPINISPTQNGKMAYLRHDPITQPCGDDLQRSYRVIGPRCR